MQIFLLKAFVNVICYFPNYYAVATHMVTATVIVAPNTVKKF